MGFGDMMKKALANENLGPQVNPGLSKEPESVEVEFLPSGKKVKAYGGQKISMIAQSAGVGIKYNCKKGDCGTCMINFDGKLVKACQTSLPSAGSSKKFKITIVGK
jgi:ferredoxin